MGISVIMCSILGFVYRRHIPNMTGMTAAMGVGMSVGLTMGVLLGVTLQDNLLTSTLLAMVIGALAGLLIGVSLSTLAVLDGGLSGLMAGMMGAMLGEMLSLADAVLLIKILLSASLCITFIVVLMFLKNKQKDEHASLKWLFRPVITFCIIILLFIGIDQIKVSSDTSHVERNKHQNHSSAESPIPNMTIDVVTSDLHYYPNEITVKRLESVELQLINNDDIDHDLEFLRIPHKEAEPNSDSIIHVHAKPRSRSTLTFTPLLEGVYEFYCTIPGHKEGGMVGTLIVN